ncbi:MAG: DUF393 domain-containing protein [Actinomycetales bacterium]|nr:DUF393 domain-containing protein [Actinomycetales bacterium]
MTQPRLAVVVFDGDCGFCTASVGWARRWIRPRVTFQAWQATDLAALGLRASACQQALQFVAIDGSLASGGRAVCRMLGTGRWPWPAVGWIGSMPGLRWVIDVAYRLVARTRHRLPGSTAACAPHASADPRADLPG